MEMDPQLQYPVSYPGQPYPPVYIQGEQHLYPVLQGTLISGYNGSATQGNHDRTPEVVAPVPRPRKTTAAHSSKQGLTSHSAMSMVKKAAAGIQDGNNTSPYNKAIYQDKRIVETLDKHILAKAEGVEAWTTYMKEEKSPCIQGLYQSITQLDVLWVQLQQKYRQEVPEQRRLFKLLMVGENEINKLLKQANNAAAKEYKVGKQLDDALLRNRASKGGLDMKKLEQLQNDLEKLDDSSLKKRVSTGAPDMKKLRQLEKELNKAVRDNQVAQKRYATGKQNHEKFKHNEIKKMMTRLSEAEVNLHQDCWKISEAKFKLCDVYMTQSSASTPLGGNIHQASNESRAIVSNLYKDLRMSRTADSEQERPLQPGFVPLTTPPMNHDPSRVIPTAPIYNTGSIRSTDSSGMGSDIADTDACYNPIPDDDSDTEEYTPQYIYDDFDDGEFDEEPEIYENVESQEPMANYLELEDDTDMSARVAGRQIQMTPALPPRQISRPPIRESDIYEETDIIIQQPTRAEDIFGSIGSLQLQRGRAPSPEEEYAYVDPQADQADTDEEGGTYGHMWEATTIDTFAPSAPSRAGRTENDVVPSVPSHTSQGSRLRDSMSSMMAVEEIRYVKYPGSVGDQPAVQPGSVKNKQMDIETALRNSLVQFNERNRNNQDTPPPLPARR